jgi:predicted RNA-binding protein with TRAM domain
MEMSDQLLCLFSARVEESDERYVVEIPRQEIDIGDISSDTVYRVAMLPLGDQDEDSLEQPITDSVNTPRDPPVQEGDVRQVTIEDIGDQGDGIARVERGFVIIVPEAEEGEDVIIEITNVAENYAIGSIVEPETSPEFL